MRGLAVRPVSWLGVRCDPVQQRLPRDANAARTEPDGGELACADEVVDLRAAEAQELGGFGHGQEDRLLFLGHSSLIGRYWNYWNLQTTGAGARVELSTLGSLRAEHVLRRR